LRQSPGKTPETLTRAENFTPKSEVHGKKAEKAHKGFFKSVFG